MTNFRYVGKIKDLELVIALVRLYTTENDKATREYLRNRLECLGALVA